MCLSGSERHPTTRWQREGSARNISKGRPCFDIWVTWWYLCRVNTRVKNKFHFFLFCWGSGGGWWFNGRGMGSPGGGAWSTSFYFFFQCRLISLRKRPKRKLKLTGNGTTNSREPTDKEAPDGPTLEPIDLSISIRDICWSINPRRSPSAEPPKWNSINNLTPDKQIPSNRGTHGPWRHRTTRQNGRHGNWSDVNVWCCSVTGESFNYGP